MARGNHLAMPDALSAPHFEIGPSGLSCDGVPLASIAERVDTPVYVYSASLIREAYRRFDAAFQLVPHRLHYALKANSSLAVLRLLRSLGSGADANSGGEIDVARRAGFAPTDIVFTGVGKTRAELAQAVSLGVKAINAESAGEVARIDAVAASLDRRARVAVRVNPDIDSGGHPFISTGLGENKFGVPIDQVRALFCEMAGRTHVEPVGVHVHIGSQILSLDPLARAARAVARLVGALREDGIRLEHVDLGGGLGISYDGGGAPGAENLAAAILPAVRDLSVVLLLEPGRVVVGPAGVLVATVVDLKSRPDGGRFVVLDSGMTELLRPALYGAYHRIEPVVRQSGADSPCDIVGPLCESSDIVGRDRLLPPLEVGDLMAVFDVGAYGSSMASNYNRRMLAPEVMIDEGQWRLVRRRQTIDDLLSLEE
jgi:diaminopimelate decarboxylase